MEQVFTFIVPTPENHVKSNGISVLLSMARIASDLGFKVCVVADKQFNGQTTSFTSPYEKLTIEQEIPYGAHCIASDTISKTRREEAKARASMINYYLLAPLGIFYGDDLSIFDSKFSPLEKLSVFSPQVSVFHPYFYYQTYFKELQPWLERPIRSRKNKIKSRNTRFLRAAFYPGKGSISKLPSLVSDIIDWRRSKLITRKWPVSKHELYNEIATLDAIITFDPLTSLSHEASLMGKPVYVASKWDESQFIESFPVTLNGISWGDPEEFTRIVRYGFDEVENINSYNNAIASNRNSALKLLHYTSAVDTPLINEKELEYWRARHSYFSSLRFSYPNSAHRPLHLALKPRTLCERVIFGLYAKITQLVTEALYIYRHRGVLKANL